jgi:hypothetical protein
VVDARSYLGVVVAVCSGTLTADLQCSGELDVGMKRILVRADRNENPRIHAVFLDGSEWIEERAIDPGEHEVRVAASSEDAQTLVQFYSTTGTFTSEVRTLSSPITRWTGASATFAIVVRDDRGGSSFVVRRARAR